VGALTSAVREVVVPEQRGAGCRSDPQVAPATRLLGVRQISSILDQRLGHNRLVTGDLVQDQLSVGQQEREQDSEGQRRWTLGVLVSWGGHEGQEFGGVREVGGSERLGGRGGQGGWWGQGGWGGVRGVRVPRCGSSFQKLTCSS